MRTILFLSFAIICCGFLRCTPMNPHQQVDISLPDSSLFFLVKKVQEADTILLTSHTGPFLDSINRKVIQQEILIRGKINRQIIHEQKVIGKNDIDTLVGILSIPKPEEDSLATHCEFDPHHTIFIISKNKISFIDICFYCCQLSTSEDLKSIYPFGYLKWERLLSLFQKLQFKYRTPSKVFSIPENIHTD